MSKGASREPQEIKMLFAVLPLANLYFLYCALIAYIIFEAPAEDRNINTLVDMISGMDVKVMTSPI